MKNNHITNAEEHISVYVSGKPDNNIAHLLQAVPYQHNTISGDLLMHECLVWQQTAVIDRLRQLNQLAKKHGKKMVVAILDDYEGRYPRFRHLLLLRTSLQKKNRRAQEWALPYVWEGQSEPFFPTQDNGKPSISFCGLNSKWRQHFLDRFAANERITTDFLIRESFWGGKPGDPGLVKEFWDNINRNAFALAPRGAGNFSMRFFQALSAGRIPVLLDTDLVLPLEKSIDWQQAIVLGKTPEECIAQVLDIWEKGQVAERQHRCYQIYHEQLDNGNYLKKLLPELLEIANHSFLKKPFWRRHD